MCNIRAEVSLKYKGHLGEINITMELLPKIHLCILIKTENIYFLTFYFFNIR